MLVFAIVFTLSLFFTYTIRYLANKKEILDHPNERSSHVVPTPKGGGLAIMLAFYSGLSYLSFESLINTELFFALLTALPVIFISLIDDIYSLSGKLRFGVQLISASAAVYFLNGVASMNFILFTLDSIWLNIIAIVGIIWMTNLYNFLDGIDGYAGSEAIFAGLGAYLIFGSDTALLLAIATAGFLLFNWHKASIFMGDVGSAPLGFIFAILILNDAATPNFLGWLMLLSLFWFDATLTLLRRVKQKERLSQAHKKHAYQRLHQAGLAHDKVVVLATLVNLVILLVLNITLQSLWPYLFILLIMVLYGLTRFIDTKKAFD